ncbi:unnamed protein product [Symbiodinium sp. CCMP2592]|nr:unnamed protein product [Symbiodinium sp. CCMP2592]
MNFNRSATFRSKRKVSNWGHADSHGASFGHAVGSLRVGADPLAFRRPAPLGMSGSRHKASLALIFLSEVVLLAWHSIGLAVGNSLAGSFFQQAPCLKGAHEMAHCLMLLVLTFAGIRKSNAAHGSDGESDFLSGIWPAGDFRESPRDLFPGFRPGGFFAWKESPGVFITAAGTLRSSMQQHNSASCMNLSPYTHFVTAQFVADFRSSVWGLESLQRAAVRFETCCLLRFAVILAVYMLGKPILRCGFPSPTDAMSARLPLVDEFSPPEGHGQWMSIVQTGVPIGQFCGVLAGAVAEDQRSWRTALLGQARPPGSVLLRLAIIPAQQIDAANQSLTARLDSLALHSPDAQLGRLQNLMRELREMLQGVNRNPLTLSLSSVLCLLHATGAGLALWTAPYLALSDGAPSPLVSLMLSALILSCCPAAGTYIGAIACYRVDGFKAGMHAVALRVACAFAALAALCAPLNSASSSFILRLFLVACWLFSAGALLPISAGLLMTSMPSYLRSFSSASTVLVLHVISFSVMPGVAAVLMGCFIRPEKHKPIGRQEYLQLTISDVASYEEGASVTSDITGPSGSFRCRLRVFPQGTAGTESSVSNALAAFVEIIPPPSAVKESCWVCKDVEFGIAVRRNVESHAAELSKTDIFSFDQDQEDRGWHDLIRWNDNKWTATTSINICAEVRGLPVADALISHLQGVSFEDQLQPVSFHLSACTLFFDQRLLVARSDYFREMFAQSKWIEGQTKEVDLRSDPLATKAAMSAILRYIVSGSFRADGDVDFAFAVRFLADRYCLKELVQLAESELCAMLCPENALSFLGRLSALKSSNCLEPACWKMIQADGCKLLEQQEHQLSQLIEENPAVAKQLILLNVRSKKRARE